jgi:hypothetical protein
MRYRSGLNYRYKERLSEIQIQSVEEIIQNFARSLNYNAK